MTLTVKQRRSIVAEAQSWLRTRYMHGCDVKGLEGGVDCAMLLVRVFCDLKLVPPIDPRPYAREWHLHHSEEKYLGWIKQYGVQVEVPQPGDIALYRIGLCVSHGAIVIDDNLVLHAWAESNCVEYRERRALRKWLDSYWSVQV